MPLQMSRARADEEEYWHSSKFRAFTFDDEDDELSQVGSDPGSAGAPRPGVRHPPSPPRAGLSVAVSAQASAPRFAEGLCFVGGVAAGLLPCVEATKGSHLAPHGGQSEISLGPWFLARAANCNSCWLSCQRLCRCRWPLDSQRRGRAAVSAEHLQV